LDTPLETLCKGHPHEFKEFLEYCRKVDFEQEPDYKYCIGLFRSCLARHEIDYLSTDFLWKRNQLEYQKQKLMQSIRGVLTKKEVGLVYFRRAKRSRKRRWPHTCLRTNWNLGSFNN